MLLNLLRALPDAGCPCAGFIKLARQVLTFKELAGGAGPGLGLGFLLGLFAGAHRTSRQSSAGLASSNVGLTHFLEKYANGLVVNASPASSCQEGNPDDEKCRCLLD